jgi:ABC-type sulfate transport system permease component
MRVARKEQADTGAVHSISGRHGAGGLTVLRRIVLPLALPSAVAAWLYVFLYTIRDLSIAILLAGPKSQVIAVVILDLWNNGEVGELAALAVLMAAAVTALAAMLMWLGRRMIASWTASRNAAASPRPPRSLAWSLPPSGLACAGSWWRTNGRSR